MTVGPVSGAPVTAPGIGKASPVNDRFSAALSKLEKAVAKPQQDASAAIDAFTSGIKGDFHETLLTVEKADISLKFMVSVRNRIVESYREVMRMGA